MSPLPYNLEPILRNLGEEVTTPDESTPFGRVVKGTCTLKKESKGLFLTYYMNSECTVCICLVFSGYSHFG
jgi:hypothetical protein